MSWSTGDSSAPGFRRAAGRRRGGESRSPVAYRENPMGYEPEVLCQCNPRRKVPRWISWSIQNPGRRYYSCVDAMNGRGCGFVEWHDDPLPKIWSDLIGDLRDEVWRLRGNQDSVVAVPVTEEAGRDANVQALEAKLKEKNEELLAMKNKYESVFCVCVVFLVGFMLGKMLMQ